MQKPSFVRSCQKRSIAVFLAAAATAVATAAEQPHWPKWRGPENSGSTETGSYPAKLDSEKAAWKALLPGKGCSTPIVWNQVIYLTAPVDGLDALCAFDWAGKAVWQKSFGQEDRGKHRNGSGSNASAVTDGESVFVYFKSGTLAGVDLAGKVRWQTNLVETFGRETLYWDHGTSPVLTDKYVVMARMHEGESWLAGFDKLTGQLRWKVARNFETAVEGDHGYSTPVVVPHQGRQAVLVWGGEHVTLHDGNDGKTLWACGDFNPERKSYWPTVASPVVVAGLAIVPHGRADRGQPRLHAIRLADGNSAGAGQRAWKREDTGTFVPTPAVYKGRVYLLRDRGELDCLEPASGKTVWSGAFPKASANFYASPVIAAGKLYAIREDGVGYVASIEPKFELLSENKLGERVIASPVAVSNRILIRGEQHLICIQ